MNPNTNLLISRHLALITHDATMCVNSSINTRQNTPELINVHRFRFLLKEQLAYSS